MGMQRDASQFPYFYIFTSQKYTVYINELKLVRKIAYFQLDRSQIKFKEYVDEFLQYFQRLFPKGFGVDSTDKNDLLYGPTFTVHPSDVTMISKTTSLFVECQASANPPAVYKWYRGPKANQTMVCRTK